MQLTDYDCHWSFFSQQISRISKFTRMTPSILWRSILSIALIIVSASLYSGEYVLTTGKNQVSFSGDLSNGYQTSINISRLQFRDINSKLGLFTGLFLPDYTHSAVIGAPDLPSFCKLIEVPFGAIPMITVTAQEYRDVPLTVMGINHRIIPTQASVSKGITDPASIPFVINESIYAQDEFYGAPLALAEAAGIFRAANLWQVTINPFRYNPVTGLLRIYTRLEFTVSWAEKDLAPTLAMKRRYASPYFEQVYGRITATSDNYDTLVTASPVTYVIVSAPEFRQALQALVKWKTKKGFRVIEGYTDEPAVGNTTTSIKAWLQSLYLSPPAGYNPPSFALFVGDVAQIPAWTNNGQATDLRYCEYTGDNMPEVFYGRFSANSLAQLQPYIDKTTEYEQYAFPDDTFLGEVVMVAGYDAGGNGLTYGNGQINYGTSEYFNAAHNLLSHTYLQPEPAGANYSQQIRNNVSDGIGYANYTAHGSEQGWGDPEFVINQIPALQNDHEYCLMVGNCCLSSKYNVNCFAEEITRAANKGAVGYIGASNNSLWDEDYWWGCGLKAVTTNPVYDPDHLGAYDVTFHDHSEPVTSWYPTMAQMVVGGNLAVQESNSGNKLYYWEIYNLMGDPSLSIYYSIPQPVTATIPSVLLVGTGAATVSAEPWSYVALSLNDSTLLDARCVDSTGSVTLQYPTLTATGMARFVITKQNRKPFIDSINVIQPTGPYITLQNVTINDSAGGNNNHKADYSENITLNVTINNVGAQQSASLLCTVTSPDTNIVILSNTFLFQNVPSNGMVTGQNAFNILINNNVPDLHKVPLTFTFTDTSGTWTGYYLMNLNAPVISIGNVYVYDPPPGGNNNGILDAGESAQLKIAVNNSGHAAVNNVTGNLTVNQGSTGYIIVNNPNTLIGNIAAPGFAFGYYPVVTNGITPAGTQVFLSNSVSAGQQGQFSAQKQVAVTVGMPPQVNIGNSTFSTCNSMFYDSGGPDADYSANETFIMTVHAGSPGAKLQANFTSFDVEQQAGCTHDYLSIYNGPSMMDPLIGTYCGNTSPGIITSTNAIGSLTFMFHSDYIINKSGWVAHLKCIGGPLSLLANSFPAVVCEGGSSQLVAVVTGGSGNYTYQWEPATYLDDPTSPTPVATPLSNITYTVTVNDGNTTLVSGPVTLEITARPVAPFITQNGSWLESNMPAGNKWYFNGNLIPNATGQTYQPTISGDYTATYTDASGNCESAMSNLITWLITGDKDPLTGNGIGIFPNPAREELNVRLTIENTDPGSVLFTDAVGRRIILPLTGREATPGGPSFRFNTQNLSPGVYFCLVQTPGNLISRKFVIVK